MTTKRWLSPTDFEKEFSIKISTQAKMRIRSKNKLPHSKVGKFIRYDRLVINLWLEENRIC